MFRIVSYRIVSCYVLCRSMFRIILHFVSFVPDFVSYHITFRIVLHFVSYYILYRIMFCTVLRFISITFCVVLRFVSFVPYYISHRFLFLYDLSLHYVLCRLYKRLYCFVSYRKILILYNFTLYNTILYRIYFELNGLIFL